MNSKFFDNYFIDIADYPFKKVKRNCNEQQVLWQLFY
jgi:hypothetical protein